MQPTFGMIDDQVRRKKITTLDYIATVIDFRKIEKLLLKACKGGGRPPIPPIMLFKALLLESWYDPSDVEVALEIHNRRSFERFIEPEIRNYHLDHTTLVKYRNRLREKGVLDRVWAEVDKAMIARNLRVKKGVFTDSTMVEGGCRPESKRGNGEPVDPDADYVKRGEQLKSGQKVYISTDDKQGLIQRMELVPITENDHRRFGELIPDDAGRVCADKGYAA
ncbi:MAG: transposase [Nitrospinota bacterium]|nr:transposase [Nitrospinota bacterium]